MQIFARFHVDLMHGLTQTRHMRDYPLSHWHVSRYDRRDANAINERRARNIIHR